MKLDKKASELNGSKSLDDLLARVRRLGADANNEDIQSIVSSTMQKLMNDAFSKIRDGVSGYVTDGYKYVEGKRFADGREFVSRECNTLRSDIRSLTASKRDDSMLAEVDDFEKSLRLEIEQDHLN